MERKARYNRSRVELDIPPCPRCGRIPSRGTRCLSCASGGDPISAHDPRPVGAGPTSVRPSSGAVPPFPTGTPAAGPVPGAAPPARWAETPRWKTNLARAGAAFVLLVLFAVVYVRCGERPSFLSLSTKIDGPSPAKARRTLFFLHGHGGTHGSVWWIADALRKAGLPDDVSIVFVEAPFSHVTGRTWGHTESDLDTSVARVRALVSDTFDSDVAPSRVFIGGFSQGAGIAADVAAKDPRIGGVASISACRFRAAHELVRRENLALFVAHGDHDSVCPPGVSRGLVEQLRFAGRQPVYVDFVDDHVITPTVVRRLVDFVRLAP